MRPEHFERLFAEHAEPLLGYLTYRTGNRALAEDLLADTFERVLRARRPFDPRKASEKTWLYTIALNCLTDHVRRQAAESRALARVGQPDHVEPDRADSFHDREDLLAALMTLSEEEREAVALRYGGDLPVKEVARITGTNRTTAEARIYRGLKRLRAWLEPEGA
ncbi:MAG TPA: RNA polymerase sigma factor [Solirubrobacteraceae bacterium]|jgi:RNA polymerase sigma-70 factor (ECF subfamily)